MKGIKEASQSRNPQQLPAPKRHRPESKKIVFLAVIAQVVVLTLFIRAPTLLSHTPLGLQRQPCPISAEGLETCAWGRLRNHVGLLDVPAIPRDEFLSRQKVLAAELAKAGVDAFVAEPSASTTYYANLSTSAWGLSERPFLLIVDKEGKFSYLVPHFEAGRASGLAMVHGEEARIIQWAEEESPYQVFRRETGYYKIMLDEHARFMIAAGLAGAGVEVVPMSETVQSLRAVKSEAELAILRGVNEFTLELVTSMQRCIRVGTTQEAARTAAHGLFARVGLGGDFWVILLFGDQAASPHGGSEGKTLEGGEFVLIDIGSSLHGYGSDVTRTILPTESTVSEELMDMWNLVHSAQAAAIERMVVNETCSHVDAVSRKVISDKGYGPYFTHRLGHGLGLEMHEHPYLNGANAEKLKSGEVVSNEPGIYVTTAQAKKELGKEVGFGVRLEDPVLVTSEGGMPLSGRTAVSPYEP